ncbi:MAG: SDR family oxidoreductase [Dehalococcoidales bacterium]|nr:SDR family oxidoreductase [Dehalococcoidales bacterium]
MDFKGKMALVTGSSGGIGKAVAVALAKEGADVILASRNVPNMQSVVKEIEALGRKAVAIRCDVADDNSVAAMKEPALKAFGGIDILINNAAVGIHGLPEYVSLDDWKYIINTNLMGYIRVLEAFLPHFMERGSGYIVNVSSIQALAYGSDPLNTAYITTKAGILGLTECLSAYLRPKGIVVSCLIPGAVKTGIHQNSHFVGTEEQIKKMQEQAKEIWKLPIFLSPGECAEGLLKGMKKEEYLIVVPAQMIEMVKAQGRDIARLNAWAANPPPPRMPPPRQ